MHRPELQKLVDNCKKISEEMASIQQICRDVSRPKTADWDTLDRDLYKKIIAADGWHCVDGTEETWWNFPVITYGECTPAAAKLAPYTADLLIEIGGVHFAGFSLLLSGGFLTPHTDKPACKKPVGKLTYHLGLSCPDDCYLIQGEKAHKEEDGKLFSFKCDKRHLAVNLSGSTRVVMYITFTK
jgi:hypothetical protein